MHRVSVPARNDGGRQRCELCKDHLSRSQLAKAPRRFCSGPCRRKRAAERDSGACHTSTVGAEAAEQRRRAGAELVTS